MPTEEEMNRHMKTLEDFGVNPMSDPVHHPAHYKSEGGMEVIDVIENFGLGFRLGNTVKYILRAGKKGNRLEDLKKARWYLDREIAKEEASAGQQPTHTFFGKPVATPMTKEEAEEFKRRWQSGEFNRQGIRPVIVSAEEVRQHLMSKDGVSDEQLRNREFDDPKKGIPLK